MTVWPHAPKHWLFERGNYMITAGTYEKVYHLHTPERRDLMQTALFGVAAEFSWELQAWAILSNHYHIVARSPDDPATLRRLIGKLHMTAAKALNRLDEAPGRKVWFQYWESHLTVERSWLARLNYVHYNPIRRGMVLRPMRTTGVGVRPRGLRKMRHRLFARRSRRSRLIA